MRVEVFPLPETPIIPIHKCNHRFDAVMSFSHQTDSRIQNSIYAFEMFGFKNNIRNGAFITDLLSQYLIDVEAVERTGLMGHDIYFGTDMWLNPETDKIEVIPDYYATAWTEAGAHFFENAIVGESKASRYPDCGDQMYSISNGKYGISNTLVMGESQMAEYLGVVRHQQDFLKSVTGRSGISAGSYRNGRAGSQNMSFPFWLGMRNSGAGDVYNNRNGNTWYGGELGIKTMPLSFREYFKSFPSTTRTHDYYNTYVPGVSKQAAFDYFGTQVDLTLENNGAVTDFMHAHSGRTYKNMETIDEFMAYFRTRVGSNFVHTCSHGELLEYLYIREMCTELVAKVDSDKIVLIADMDDEYKGITIGDIPMDVDFLKFTTPLSVNVDLTNTVLAGKNVIASSGKIRSLGANVYIVDMPLISRSEGFMSVELIEGLDGVYNEARPTATISITGNTMKVVSDMPTKAVLYSVGTGGFDYDSLPADRDTSFRLEREFIYEEGNDYRVGLISEFGQASLIEI